jgi:hypothetical protein
MARPGSPGPKLTDLLGEILEQFRLVGEDIVRASTGKVVQFRPQAKRGGYGRSILVSYHRVKFALAWGFLPRTVDHRDTDRSNNEVENLRAATHQEQNRNRARPGGLRKSGLPRGVTRRRNGRFTAAATVDRKVLCLGTFDTAEEASANVEAYLKVEHGAFYRAA